MVGWAGDGRFSATARIDFARAAALVLTGDDPAGKVYEQVGDEAFYSDRACGGDVAPGW